MPHKRGSNICLTSLYEVKTQQSVSVSVVYCHVIKYGRRVFFVVHPGVGPTDIEVVVPIRLYFMMRAGPLGSLHLLIYVYFNTGNRIPRALHKVPHPTVYTGSGSLPLTIAILNANV